MTAGRSTTTRTTCTRPTATTTIPRMRTTTWGSAWQVSLSRVRCCSRDCSGGDEFPLSSKGADVNSQGWKPLEFDHPTTNEPHRGVRHSFSRARRSPRWALCAMLRTYQGLTTQFQGLTTLAIDCCRIAAGRRFASASWLVFATTCSRDETTPFGGASGTCHPEFVNTGIYLTAVRNFLVAPRPATLRWREASRLTRNGEFADGLLGTLEAK